MSNFIRSGVFYRKTGVGRNDTLTREREHSRQNRAENGRNQGDREISMGREGRRYGQNYSRDNRAEEAYNNNHWRRWTGGEQREQTRFGNRMQRDNERAQLQQGGWNRARNIRTRWVETENSDFTRIVKGGYRHAQIRHHEAIWDALPRKISRQFHEAFQTITPPYPDEELRRDFEQLETELQNSIRTTVQAHLKRARERNIMELSQLNPDEKEKALEITYRQLSRNLGRKISHEDKAKFLTEASNIMANRDAEMGQAEEETRTLTREEEIRTENVPDEPSARENVRNEDPPEEAREQEDGIRTINMDIETTNRKRIRSSPQINTIVGRLNLEDSPSQEAARCKKNRMVEPNESGDSKNKVVHQRQNKVEWEVKPMETTKIIIIGDSNLTLARQIPENVEVHAFPGMLLQHATAVLRKLPRLNNPIKVIIAVGINHRDWSWEDLEPEMEDLHRTIGDFGGEIYLAGVPLNNKLNQDQRGTLTALNNKMKEWQEGHFISPILTEEVEVTPTDRYRIHHTQETTDKVMQSFYDFLV